MVSGKGTLLLMTIVFSSFVPSEMFANIPSFSSATRVQIWYCAVVDGTCATELFFIIKLGENERLEHGTDIYLQVQQMVV